MQISPKCCFFGCPFLGSRKENEQERGSVGAEPPDNRIVDSNFISSPAANETKFVRTRQLNHHASSCIDVPKWKCRKLFYAKQMNETEECHTIVENYAGLKSNQVCWRFLPRNPSFFLTSSAMLSEKLTSLLVSDSIAFLQSTRM